MELRTTREGVANLRTYLRTSGIFSLNNNPWLPSLDDIGCRWEDMVDLVNNRELFFCKLYRKRSVYLTPAPRGRGHLWLFAKRPRRKAGRQAGAFSVPQGL